MNYRVEFIIKLLVKDWMYKFSNGWTFLTKRCVELSDGYFVYLWWSFSKVDNKCGAIPDEFLTVYN